MQGVPGPANSAAEAPEPVHGGCHEPAVNVYYVFLVTCMVALPIASVAVRDRFIRLGWGVPALCDQKRLLGLFAASHLKLPETRGRARRQLAPMRLTLIALSASYCVDALLAISTSTKASSHSCEAARRSVTTAGMAAVSGRTALAAAHRPRATIICRDGFFDSVTGQCNACVMHVHCHRVHRTQL